MKKLIYILFLSLFIGLSAHAQETPPTGLKSINSQFYIYVPDSSIWHQKGAPYGWERLARYKDILNAGNIYNTDGSLTGTRSVNLNNKTLIFSDNQSGQASAFAISKSLVQLTVQNSSTHDKGLIGVSNSGAQIGYANTGTGLSNYLTFYSGGILVDDQINNIGLINNTHHTITSGLQLAEIQDINNAIANQNDTIRTITGNLIIDPATGLAQPGLRLNHGSYLDFYDNTNTTLTRLSQQTGEFWMTNIGSSDLAVLKSGKWYNRDSGGVYTPYLKQGDVIATDKQDTLGSVYNILHFGGKFDGSTDNTTALAAIKSGYGKFKTIYFPQNNTGTAVYYFTTQPNFDYYNISADDSVTLSVPSTDLLSWKNVKFSTKIRIRARDKNNTGKQQANTGLEDFWPILSGISKDEGFGSLTSLDCTTTSGFTYNTSTDTKTTASLATLAALSVTFGSGVVPSSAVADSLTYLTSEVTPIIGNMYNAAFTTSASNVTGGYAGMMVYSGAEWLFFQVGSNGYKLTSKKTGIAATYTYLPNTYSPAYLLQGTATIPLFSVRVVSPLQVEFYVNGSLIKSYTMAGTVTSIGWGVNRTMNATGSQLATTVTYGSVVKKAVGKKLNLGVFGDSITFGAGSSWSWAKFVQYILKGTAGVYDVNYTNYAHSGDVASDVLDSLNAHSVTLFSHCLVLIGTNNIQQGTSIASFSTSLRSVIAKIKADGSIPVIGIPPMFTDTSQTHTGTVTTNYAKGGLYRATIMKICADSSVMVADVLSDIGGIDNLSVQLRDNIHPQSLYQATIGRSFAKAILNNIQKNQSTYVNGEVIYGSTTNDGTSEQSTGLNYNPANNWLRIGTNAPTNTNTALLGAQIVGTNAGLGMERQANASQLQFFRYNGTYGSKTKVTSQNILASINAWGYGASAYNSNPSAIIQYRAQTDFSGNNKSTAIDFMTTQATTNPLRRMMITGAGDIIMGSDSTVHNNYKLFVDPETGRTASAVFNALSTAPVIIRNQTDTTKSITISPTTTGIGLETSVPLNINATSTQPVTVPALTATSINKVTITAPATSAVLTIANGKTLTASNSLTLAGTDATIMTFPSTSTNIVGNPNGALNILASTQTTLVAGTKALSVTGVTTGSHAQVTLVSQGGTVSTTGQYEAVCTAGTVTINAVTTGGTNVLNTLDTSIVNVFVTN